MHEDEHDQHHDGSHSDFDDEDNMLIKMLIAQTSAGCVIGKGGSVINEFQTQTGSRIQLSRNGETFPGTTDRVISLRGGVEQILQALHLMISKLAEEGESMVDENSRVRLIVPNASCGAIIGKGGATIRAFAEDSEADIKLSSQDRMLPGVTDRVLTITGPAGNVLRAVALVSAALFNDGGYLPHAKRPSAFLSSSPIQSGGGNGSGRNGGSNSRSNHSAALDEISETVAVPDEHIGAVLGKGGRTISEIQVASGVRIKVSDRGDFYPGTRNRKVTLYGTAEGVKTATALLREKLSNPGNPSGGH